MVDLTSPIYNDPIKAREHLEAVRWPDGPVCPHCGTLEVATKLQGKSTRPGVYKCKACRQPYTVTVGSVFERSKIGLHKWVLATHLLAASKKGMSSHQLARMLGVTYKTAWFMTHRIREAMSEKNPSPLGGEGKVVEADETYIGGKAKNRAFEKEPPKKAAVFSLVERGGKVRSQHVPTVNAATLRPIIVKKASRKSFFMTDEAHVYKTVGKEFAAHAKVNHAADEYVRDEIFHTNTIENYFSILKRGLHGVYQAVSEKHLHRYVSEFDFRYNTRHETDFARADAALKGAEGKRLTYRRIGERANG